MRAPESHILAYSKLIAIAHKHNQVVGEKNDYYVTLAQVERALCIPTDTPQWRQLGPEHDVYIDKQSPSAFVK